MITKWNVVSWMEWGRGTGTGGALLKIYGNLDKLQTLVNNDVSVSVH